MSDRPQRAAIYARFSSDLQDARSAADQVALCRDHARRQHWAVVQVYADEAVSVASLHGRDALMRMIGDAERGSFDVILVEHIDRLARNAADTIRLREQMEFIGIEIHTCASGLVTEMHAGLEGLMSAMYLKQLAVHVRRGQAGRVREGLSGGGITYGYAPVPGKRGKRIIVEAEAAVVRRIFAEYHAGRTPRAIAIDLNRERIPAPRGDFSSATAIVGNRKRGSGLLSNALYDGRLVWNKVSMRKDPRTGKRVSRINPESSWQITSVPDLRIIDADVFAAVQARLDERGHEWPTAPRRPWHLLSGLLRCGCCGRSLVVKDRDAKGRRIYCTRLREGGGCANTRAFYLDEIERRVLAGLEAQLKDPRGIERFLKTYTEERKRLAAAEEAKRHRKETRLGEVKREFDRAFDSYIKGIATEEETRPRLAALREERKALEEELTAMQPPTNVVTLHPGAVKRYLEIVDDLATSLPRRTVSGDEGIAAALRELISCVTITPAEKGPPIIDITGRLAVLTGTDLFPSSRGEIIGSGGAIPPMSPKRIPPEMAYTFLAA
jgi:DNA invertase Pin-like site-specific DNA recombinase